MAFTYDISTDRGKVRALCTDTDSTNYTFNDAEIDAFIELAPANLFAAAALAAETWARTRSKLAVVMRNADGSSTERSRMNELLVLARSLREAALSGGLVSGAISASTPNELLDSYRPEWRGINDLPVVE